MKLHFRFIAVIFALFFVAPLMASCDQLSNVPQPPPPPPAKSVLHISREAPQQVKVGDTFTVKLTVRVDEAVAAVLVKELVGGLTLADPGSDFTLAQQDTLQGVILKPSAGSTKTFTYQLRCPKAIPYTIVGEASTKGSDPAYAITTVTCVEK
jgi:hypothetical protein